MDPLLDQPSVDLDRSAEDMLDELEALLDSVQLKRGTLDDDTMKKIDDARTLVEKKSALAKNAIEDAAVRLRELATR